jgi:hypothetical protein
VPSISHRAPGWGTQGRLEVQAAGRVLLPESGAQWPHAAFQAVAVLNDAKVMLGRSTKH